MRTMNQTMNLSRKLILYASPGILTGVSIGALNVINYQKSPAYKGKLDFNDYLRFSTMIGIKGTIYGACYPISITGIVLDCVGNKKSFNKHFIPFSKYGN